MRRTRWWPVSVILIVACLWLGQVWLVGDAIGQERVTKTLAIGILATLSLLVWLLLLSRLPRRTRLLGLGGLLAVGGIGIALFRVHGVTGDVVPILVFRWTPREAANLPAPPPAPLGPPPFTARAKPAPEAEPEPTEAETPSETPLAGARPPASSNYPQFLGPMRNGTVGGPPLARDWEARPPRLVWRQPIGTGWSSFAAAGEHAVTQEQRGPDELVVDYDLLTGRVRWTHSESVRYESALAGDGPRATPTLAGGRVYTMGSTGILNALDLETGRPIWSRDVFEDNGAQNPQWGKSCSPLVTGRLVVVSAGGSGGRSLVAYDEDTGERVWAGGDDASGYASPFLATLAGQPQVVIFNRSSVAGHHPESGKLLWQFPWSKRQPNVAQPLPVSDDSLLVSSGYGVGSKRLRISRNGGDSFAASLVWETPRLRAKFANLVLHEGFVYGLDDGILTCLDPATGERRWKSGRYGHGQVILARDLLLLQTERGEIVLLEPSPEERRELTRFAALDGKTWNPPALAGAHLLVRNDREAALYELPLE